MAARYRSLPQQRFLQRLESRNFLRCCEDGTVSMQACNEDTGRMPRPRWPRWLSTQLRTRHVARSVDRAAADPAASEPPPCCPVPGGGSWVPVATPSETHSHTCHESRSARPCSTLEWIERAARSERFGGYGTGIRYRIDKVGESTHTDAGKDRCRPSRLLPE